MTAALITSPAAARDLLIAIDDLRNHRRTDGRDVDPELVALQGVLRESYDQQRLRATPMAAAESLIQDPTMERSDLLDYPDVAAKLRCSVRAVQRLVEQGKLPVFRLTPSLPRVRRIDLAHFLGLS